MDAARIPLVSGFEARSHVPSPTNVLQMDDNEKRGPRISDNPDLPPLRHRAWVLALFWSAVCVASLTWHFLSVPATASESVETVLLRHIALMAVGLLGLGAMTWHASRGAKEYGQAQKALRESETRFRSLVETAPSVVLYLSPEGQILEFNAEAERVYGISRAEALGRDYLESFVRQDARTAVADDIAKVLAGEPTRGYENPIRVADGTDRVFSWNVDRLLDDGGRPTGIVAVGQDITERKRAEQDRSAYLRYLENMERIDLAILEATDIEQMTKDVMETTLAVFGCDRAWLVYPCDPDASSMTVPIECTRPEWPGAHATKQEIPVTAAETQCFQEALDSKVAVVQDPNSGRPLPDAVKPFSVQSQMVVALRPKVGKPWLLGLHQCSYARLWTQEEQTALTDIARWITDGLTSLLVYRNLCESEEKYRTLVETAPDYVAHLDRDGTIQFINRAAPGLTVEQVTGTNILDYIPPERHEVVKGALRAVFEARQSDAREMMGEWPQGRDSWYWARINPIIQDGDVVGATLIATDITERVKSERQLRLLSSAVDQSSEGLAILDVDGKLLFANQSFGRMHGRKSDEMLGQPLSAFHLPGEAAGRDVIQQVIKTGDFNVELQHSSVDGNARPAWLQGSLLRDETGNATGVILTLRDMSERKRAEDLMRIQRDLGTALSTTGSRTEILSRILETALNIEGIDCGGVYLVDEDTGGLDLACHAGLSPEFLRNASHYEPDTANARFVMDGKPVYTLLPHVLPSGNEALLPEGLTSLAVVPVLHEGKAVAAFNLASHTHAEIPAHSRQVIEAVASQIGGVVARVQTEEALRASENRFRELAELLPEIVWETDLQANLTFANRAAFEVFDYSQEDFENGVNCLDMIVPQDRAKARTNFEEALKGELGALTEYTALRKDGSTFPVYLRSTAILDQGQPVGLRGLVIDVSERKRAETALRESEERFRILFEEAPDAIYLIDSEGDFVDGNRAAEEITGYKREDLIGKNFATAGLMAPSDIPKALDRFAQHIAGHAVGPDEFALKRRDGSHVTLEIRTFPVKIGSERFALGIARDITERKRADEALRASEERFRSLFENSPDAIFVEDQNGNVLDVNPAACRLHGMDRHTLVGKNVLDLVPPDRREELALSFPKLIKGELDHAEGYSWTKDGCAVPVELSASRFHYAGGAAVLLHVRDITERKRAEEELAHTQSLLTSVVMQSSVPMVVAMPDGTVTIFNEACRATLGIEDELHLQPGLNLFEFEKTWKDYDADGNVVPLEQSGLALALSGKTTRALETRVVRKDGTERWGLVDAVPIRNDAGDIIAGFTVFSDITERKRAEQTVREREARLQSIFRAAPVGIGVVADRVLNEANERLVEISGYSRDELVGQSVRMLYATDEDFEYAGKEKYRQISERGTGTVETRWKRKDGALIDVLLSSTPLDPHDHSRGFTSTVLDITERKHAEQALRLSEFTLNHCGDAIFWMDRNGRFANVNNTACRSLGYSRDELLTMSLNQIDDSFRAEEWPMQWDAMKRRRNAAQESFHRTKGGRVFPVEVSADFVDFEGQQYICAFARDITERKQAEEALKESEERFRILFQQAADSVVLVDPDTHVLTQFNDIAHRNLGYRRDEFAALKLQDLEILESPRDTKEHIARIQKQGQDTFETQLRARNGEPRDFLMKIRTVSVSGKDYLLGIWHDITDQRRTEAAMRQHREELAHVARLATLGEMAAGLAHEVNQPLAAIVGYADGCLTGLETDSLTRDGVNAALKKISESGQRAGAIIHRLRTLVTKRTPRCAAISVNDAIQQVLALIVSDLRQSQVELQVNLSDDLPPVLADSIQIQQVVLNIVRNSLDAMSQTNAGDTRILIVRTSASGNQVVRVDVRDTGPGFPAAQLDRVFEPFLTTKADGLGMGLSISRSLVEANGGELWLADNSADGATFSFALPVDPGHAEDEFGQRESPELREDR